MFFPWFLLWRKHTNLNTFWSHRICIVQRRTNDVIRTHWSKIITFKLGFALCYVCTSHRMQRTSVITFTKIGKYSTFSYIFSISFRIVSNLYLTSFHAYCVTVAFIAQIQSLLLGRRKRMMKNRRAYICRLNIYIIRNKQRRNGIKNVTAGNRQIEVARL